MTENRRVAVLATLTYKSEFVLDVETGLQEI